MPYVPVVDQGKWSRAVVETAKLVRVPEEEFTSEDWEKVREKYRELGGDFRTVTIPEPIISGDDERYDEVNDVPRVSGLMTNSAPYNTAASLEEERQRQEMIENYERQGAYAAADFVRFSPKPDPEGTKKKPRLRSPQAPMPPQARKMLEDLDAELRPSAPRRRPEIVPPERPAPRRQEALRQEAPVEDLRRGRGRRPEVATKKVAVEDTINDVLNGGDAEEAVRRLLRGL